jgi:hypothetical protein
MHLPTSSEWEQTVFLQARVSRGRVSLFGSSWSRGGFVGWREEAREGGVVIGVVDDLGHPSPVRV